jgi:signal transduction histidine kinase
MAGEHAALRRVATLVGRGEPHDIVLGAVVEEAGRLLPVAAVGLYRFESDRTISMVGRWGRSTDGLRDGNPLPPEAVAAAAEVARTAEFARPAPTVAGTPLVVDGRLWGALVAGAVDSSPPAADLRRRLAEQAEMAATAITQLGAHVALNRLADEQAALRRIATLVAEGAPADDLFAQVAEDVARLLGPPVQSAIFRYDSDRTVTCMAVWGDYTGSGITVGASIPFAGDNVTARVFREHRPARYDDYRQATGDIAERAKKLGIRSAIGSPILVRGRVWGTIVVRVAPGNFAPDAEQRLTRFTELIATAIANAEAHAELARLADEQAALRRIATLVAEGGAAEKLFAQVAADVANLLGPTVQSAIFRYERDETAICLAQWGEPVPGGVRVGAKVPVRGENATAKVYRDRRPVRFDDYSVATGVVAEQAKRHGFRAAIGCPILVQGRLWGMIFVAHDVPEPFPPGTEGRLTRFTELIATAISNAAAHAELERLANEQAALRRLAMLVAQGAQPAEVFDAVAVELHAQTGAAEVGLMRVESTNELTILAYHGQAPGLIWPGKRVKLDGDSASAKVLRTGRSARHVATADGAAADGEIAQLSRQGMIAVAIGAPVVVSGQVWGILTASWRAGAEPPVDAEERLLEFAELVDTTIANADSRSQLIRSRARMLSAADDARRRVVRDLHDGAQQRLVHTIITLKLARRAVRDDPGRVESLLSEALEHAEQGNVDLRELAHGILPSVLTRGGLRAGVESVVARLDLPVEVDVTAIRLPPEIEASGYFIIAEALTNVVKHARAGRTVVSATVDDSALHIQVRDDGVGGADPEGHGLMGVSDRVAALGGSLRIDSPTGGGTALTAHLPILI